MKKILIVEDELAYTKLLRDELSAKGYVVFEAINGEKGLEIAKKEKPDLILLDIKMPIMDGMEMLNVLREEEWGKKIKVIVLTNLEPDDKIIGEIVKNQPVFYFVKSDIKFASLFEKIQDLLS